MKKLIIVVALAILPLAGYAKDRKGTVPVEKLMALISEYKGHDGFEVMKIGSFGTSILKSALRISTLQESDDDMKKAMKVMKDIKKMAIVDYEDCAPAVKNDFNKKLQQLLGSAELLMEVKDNDDNMNIYGIVNGEGSEVHDLVMHAPQEGALICLFGSIPTEAIMEIISED